MGHRAARQQSVRDAEVRSELSQSSQARENSIPFTKPGSTKSKEEWVLGKVGTASPPEDTFCQSPCSILVLFSALQQFFPALLLPPALTLLCITGFISQVGAIQDFFCTYLVSQRQAWVGIPIWLLKLDNGDESRLRVLILTGVAQGQRVGLQDKSKRNSDPGAQHCKGWLELTANSVSQGSAKNV